MVSRLSRQKLIIHARGPFAAYLAIGLRRFCPWLGIERVLYDCRGDLLAEYSEYRGRKTVMSRLRMAQLHRLEKHVLAHADHVNVVSKALEEMLRARYGYQGPCNVTPSAFDVQYIGRDAKKRTARRDQFVIQNKIVLVYSGSMLSWQLPRRELVAIFKRFQSISSRRASFLF